MGVVIKEVVLNHFQKSKITLSTTFEHRQSGPLCGQSVTTEMIVCIGDKLPVKVGCAGPSMDTD